MTPLQLPETIPPLYAQETISDPIVYAVLFQPHLGWKYYVTEYDQTKRLGFGLVEGFEKEFGYFNADELEENGILQVTDWTPIPLSQAAA